MEEKKNRARGWFGLLAGILLFSSIETVSKLIETGMPPLRTAAVRFLTGSMVLMPWVLQQIRRRALSLGWRDLQRFLLLGFVGVLLSIGLFHIAVSLTKANVAALVFSCNPAFVILFAPLLLKEKLHPARLLAALCCLAGTAVIAAGVRGGQGSVSFHGTLLMLVSAVLFALFTVLLKKYSVRYGALILIAAGGFFGGLMLVPVSLLVEGAQWAAMPAADWGWLIYLSVVATGFAYLFYFYGIGTVGASAGSMSFFLKPFIAALLAWLLLNETLSLVTVAGGLIILAGLFINLRAR